MEQGAWPIGQEMKIDKQLYIYLFVAFVIATILGTVSHEFGHYIIAKYLGYNAQIHYAYTSISHSDTLNHGIQSGRIWIKLGGPLQTMITGTIGLGLVIFSTKRKSFSHTDNMSFRHWLFIFLSLFWLRQPAILFLWLLNYFKTGHWSRLSDEIKIAQYFRWPIWTILVITSLTGLVVLAIILFRYIPERVRLTFLLSGLAGGVSGYILWLIFVGKLIIP